MNNYTHTGRAHTSGRMTRQQQDQVNGLAVAC